ncbi:hypothetical protein ES332_D01G119600v1 [Gossypium tomentosum]|uniref:Uncharacterized protein n=1 Tax=Gossypium tomentosum TaxID=34277 RepID=A0A5D2M806_GOSTO|nr:hypothetical protein ES332_D01G119600v1 [Gossypium tomentosum]
MKQIRRTKGKNIPFTARTRGSLRYWVGSEKPKNPNIPPAPHQRTKAPPICVVLETKPLPIQPPIHAEGEKASSAPTTRYGVRCQRRAHAYGGSVRTKAEAWHVRGACWLRCLEAECCGVRRIQKP